MTKTGGICRQAEMQIVFRSLIDQRLTNDKLILIRKLISD
jgi:hypothetical protein